MKQNTIVPNTGRHKRDAALLATGSEYSLTAGTRIEIDRFTHTEEITKRTAVAGMTNAGGRSVMRK